MIFREYGGLAGTPVTDAGRCLIMSVVLGELREHLGVYKKNSYQTDFLQTLLQVIAEFKSSGITYVMLEQFALDCEPGPLKEKLADLSIIYTAYQGMLHSGYSDPEDFLIRACQLLELNDYFSGMDVYVDGFTTFMSAEFELLGHIISQAETVTFAMTTDEIEDRQNGIGVFSVSKRAIRKLIRFAEMVDVSVGDTMVLDNPVRYKNHAISHLSKYFMKLPAERYDLKTADIHITASSNDYEQCKMVAAAIHVLVREKGYHYRDIAIVARDIDPFRCALSLAFEEYGISYYLDRRRDVENTPIVFAIFTAMDVLRDNFDAESMILLAKSPVMGFDETQVAMLENYVYIWDVRGRLWQNEFRNNPRGMVEGLTREDEAVLETINRLRLCLIKPLLRLRDSLREGSGKGIATGIYSFLEEINASKHLVEYAGMLTAEDSKTFLDENTRLWDSIMDILDLFGVILENSHMPWRKFCELFRMAISSTDIGSLPQTLDQVLVGNADRIRPGAVRAAFIIGANEGVFPRHSVRAGIFTEDERETLISGGIEIASTGLVQSVLERYFAYHAVTLPGEYLSVYWSSSSLDGGIMRPSLIVEELEAILPQREGYELDPLQRLAGERSAVSLLASNYHQDSVLASTLIEYFNLHNLASVPERMQKLSQHQDHELKEEVNTRALFGNEMRLSPSRVERYHRCAYAYFMQDGLNLKKRRRAEYSPLESGSIIHHVLQVIVQKYGGKGLAKAPEKQLNFEVEALIYEYLGERIEDMEHIPVRMRYLFQRLCDTLVNLLQRLGREFNQSLFEPVAFELSIRRGGMVEPLSLITPDGISVSVEGIADRVDVMEKNGKRYVRVVDYKSGGRDFRLDDVICGLNLQMLLYLFTIQERGTGELGDSIPAGVLYMPVNPKYVSAYRGDDSQNIRRESETQLRMDGLLIDDPDILSAMEEGLEGIFIPAKKGKDGSIDARSSVASPAQLGLISRKVKRIICDMANAVSRGQIQAKPVDGEQYDICANCDYRSACGFEPEDPVRRIAKMDREAIYKMLEQEELSDVR